MTDKTPRQTKTAAQRAQEAVDVLQRRYERLADQKADLETQARALAPEIAAVKKRLDYALEHPDLPKQPNVPYISGAQRVEPTS